MPLAFSQTQYPRARHGRPRPRYRMAILPVLSTLALAIAFPTAASAQGRAAAVQVEPVIERNISETRSVLGQLVVPVEADIAARTAGVIASVNFQVGDTITQGRELVRLETELLEIEKRTAESALRVAQAGIAVAEAKLKQAEIAFNRQAQLRNSGAFSKSRYEDLRQEAMTARAELDRAKAQADNASAAIAKINYQLKYAVIRAPVAGTIIKRSAQPGAYLKVGDPIATVLDISKLEISADVPANLLRGLRPGAKVDAKAGDGTRFTATVRAVIPVEALTTQTRPVRFSADFSKLDPASIASGKSIEIQIPTTAPRTVLMVPKDALVQGNQGWIVYAVTDGKAMLRPLKIGSSNGRFVEVVSGLQKGENVVVRGNERLRPGQPVMATQSKRPVPPERS